VIKGKSGVSGGRGTRERGTGNTEMIKGTGTRV
jgi:hypothetical protein